MATTAPWAAPEHVAVVARDDLTLARIGDALRTTMVSISESAPDVEGLSDQAAGSTAILLADGTTAPERKMQVHAAAARFPGNPLVVIAAASRSGVHKALEAGAAGLVLDSQIAAALVPTIRAVAVGQVVVPGEMRRHATRPALSHRERETLALVVKGLTNRQIAARLYLAESTVKTHLTSVFAKLGVGSRSEAVALVLDPDTKLGLGVLGLAPGANGKVVPEGDPH
jgi:DNA-binding NarL/FixJ family response regulator